MINISLYSDIENDKKKLQQQAKPYLATVIETTTEGVKIRIDGEKEPRETYYNSLTLVDTGGRVYVTYISGTILILGKLQY